MATVSIPTRPSLPSAHPREGSGSPFLSCISIFPTATADVDMSKRYRSDGRAAGADTQKGFVPKTYRVTILDDYYLRLTWT